MSVEQKRTYQIQNSEKCYRFKPEAFCDHAPNNLGIYELVTFDEKQQAQVLYVGAAFEKPIRQCLEEHASGDRQPASKDLFDKYPNLYFDYLTQLGGKTKEDAQDVYWWLIQKHKPPYNNSSEIKNSGRPGDIEIIELD